jgi:hypothetical protein
MISFAVARKVYGQAITEGGAKATAAIRAAA